MEITADENVRPAPDQLLTTIAEYVTRHRISSDTAYQHAIWCLQDALGCAMRALQYPACTKLLGPIVPNTVTPLGARVPGTSYVLDPILAAFNIGSMIRWLDFNDTWLASEWGHPSDNLGAILADADYESRQRMQQGLKPYTMHDVLTAQIKAYEIQGILALENSFNRIGLDHVVLVKVASTAVAMHLLGGNSEAISNALSQAWVDGQALRTYRHSPNTGSRKSWAAGDATSRAVRLAWLTRLGEMGYPSALSAKTWGFCDATLHKPGLALPRAFDSYVIENILYKIAYPAEFHAQTAVEAATQCHPLVRERLDKIEKIVITTQESAIRIISKQGPLYNPADRDHCLQYMVAIGLLTGNLTDADYEDERAADPRIDALRAKMQVVEDKTMSVDYMDPNKRSIGNAIQVFFKDGSKTDVIRVDYPLGHARRRDEGIPLLEEKFKRNLQGVFNENEIHAHVRLFKNPESLFAMSVCDFMDLWIRT